MATCGYICPACGGNGFKDDGTDCDWCTFHESKQKTISEEELKEWIENVHQGPCCSDFEEPKNEQGNV